MRIHLDGLVFRCFVQSSRPQRSLCRWIGMKESREMHVKHIEIGEATPATTYSSQKARWRD